MLSSLFVRNISKFTGKQRCETNIDKETIQTQKIVARRVSVIREDSKEEFEADPHLNDRLGNKNILETQILEEWKAERQEKNGVINRSKDIGREKVERKSGSFDDVSGYNQNKDKEKVLGVTDFNTKLNENSSQNAKAGLKNNGSDSNLTSARIKMERMSHAKPNSCSGEDLLNRSSELRLRYSDGDLLRPVLKKSLNCQKRVSSRDRRRYSTVTFQELKLPQAEEKPTIQCRGRRHAICEELERVTFYSGLSLRQWRKVILTNEILQNYEIRW